MAQVIEMRPKSEKARSKFTGCDLSILKWVAEWREARAAQQLVWARYEHDTLHGFADTLGTPSCDVANLERMQECEFYLTQFRPTSALAAEQLLGVVLDMLAHEAAHPGSTLGDGSAFEILKKVREAVQFTRGDFRLVPKNAKE